MCNSIMFLYGFEWCASLQVWYFVIGFSVRGFVKSLRPPVDAAFNCITQRWHIGLQSARTGKGTILLATKVLNFTGPMFMFNPNLGFRSLSLVSVQNISFPKDQWYTQRMKISDISMGHWTPTSPFHLHPPGILQESSKSPLPQHGSSVPPWLWHRPHAGLPTPVCATLPALGLGPLGPLGGLGTNVRRDGHPTMLQPIVNATWNDKQCPTHHC